MRRSALRERTDYSLADSEGVLIRFEVLHATGEPAPQIVMHALYVDGSEEIMTSPTNVVHVTQMVGVREIIIRSTGLGHWGVSLKAPFKDTQIRLPALPQDGPLGWWHRMLNITTPSLDRGSGVRIGVIDQALEWNPQDFALAHLVLVGNAELRRPKINNGLLPSTHHSSSIVSLLFSRSTSSSGYQGIAPGAEAYFYGARIPERFIEEAEGNGLDPTQVALAIIDLAKDHQCDIIVVSAGDYGKDEDYLHDAIIEAQELGTMCFFASGNLGGALSYPACYEEAMSVAAIGKRSFAPAGSFEADHDRMSLVNSSPDTYLWAGSCIGSNLKFVAPGSNVIWDHGGVAADALNGTSWAAPVSAGTAAIILSETKTRWNRFPRGKERWNEFLTILGEYSDRLDLPPDIVRIGLLKLLQDSW